MPNARRRSEATPTGVAPKFYTIPAGTKPVICNGPHCGKSIFFVFNSATGRTVPVDADVEGGKRPSVEKHADKNQLGMFGVGEAKVFDGKGQSHFLHCPDAGQFSRNPR